MIKWMFSKECVCQIWTEDEWNNNQLLVSQIVCPLGSSSKKGNHVYFLLIVAMVLLLWRQIELSWHQVTMVASEQHLWQNNSITQKTCNRKYTWLPFLLLPPRGYSIRGTENWDLCLITLLVSQTILATLSLFLIDAIGIFIA